ncbi:MAG: hypothetical protein ACQEUM_07035 [Pseudomonadota bacterium]
MSRALRLHERHTRAELAAKIQALRDDPESQQAGSLHLLTPKAQRLLDDLLWAHYWHDAPKGGAHMARAEPQTKWW